MGMGKTKHFYLWYSDGPLQFSWVFGLYLGNKGTKAYKRFGNRLVVLLAFLHETRKEVLETARMSSLPNAYSANVLGRIVKNQPDLMEAAEVWLRLNPDYTLQG